MQDYDANEPHVDGDGVGQNKEDGRDVLMLDFTAMKKTPRKTIMRGW